jgi:hypothetical protein
MRRLLAEMLLVLSWHVDSAALKEQYRQAAQSWSEHTGGLRRDAAMREVIQKMMERK